MQSASPSCWLFVSVPASLRTTGCGTVDLASDSKGVTERSASTSRRTCSIASSFSLSTSQTVSHNGLLRERNNLIQDCYAFPSSTRHSSLQKGCAVESVESSDPDPPHFARRLDPVKHGLPHLPSEDLGERLPLVVSVISTAAGATNHGGLSIGCCSTTVPVRRNHVGRDTVDDEPGGVRRE